MRFDKFCDDQEAVRKYSPAIRCDSACVTVFEPQFFGGRRGMIRRLQGFLRRFEREEAIHLHTRLCYRHLRDGDVAAGRSGLHAPRHHMPRAYGCRQYTPCLKVRKSLLRISEIWPEAMSDDMVTVCSCTATGCNLHDHDVLSSSAPYSKYPTTSSLAITLVLFLTVSMMHRAE